MEDTECIYKGEFRLLGGCQCQV